MRAERADQHPPTLTLLLATGTLALGLAALVGGAEGWASGLALDRESSPSWLSVVAHPLLNVHPVALTASLILLLAAGHVVEARVGPAWFAGLVAAGSGASAVAWRWLGSAPTWSGGGGYALGLVAAALVLSPRLGVGLPAPRLRASIRVEWLLGLGLGATALVLGADLPPWLLVPAYAVVLAARLHDHAEQTVAAVHGDALELVGARVVVLPAWLIALALLAAYAGLGRLGLLGDVAPLVAGVAGGAGLALALTCAGRVSGTHDQPTLVEALGLRPRPARPDERLRGRLPWDPTLPGPGLKRAPASGRPAESPGARRRVEPSGRRSPAQAPPVRLQAPQARGAQAGRPRRAPSR